MKVSVTIIALACMGLMFANQSVADLDPATIEGLWLFNDGTGKVAKDTSGNKLDGTLENNPKWVNGKFGKAIEFDGSGAHVVIKDHESPRDALTVFAWVKSNTPTWNQHGWIVEKRNAYIIHPNQGTVNVAFPICNGGCWNKPGGWADGSIGPKDITQWHMYTGTFDSKTGEWKIYIDGKVESELDLTKNQIDADSGPIYIGNDTCCAGRFADAIVDEVIILSVALAEDDVKSLAELGIEGALAVHPTNKLPTTWGSLKRRY